MNKDHITLNKRYQIISKIGSGGMAEVFHGYDTLLNRDVAIKILRDQYITDKEFVTRFKTEACAAASLVHPNIVNVFDVGVENDIYYMVLEKVSGITLKEYLALKGPLPISEALRIAQCIASALQYAHEHNLVHCDIKPHNILITSKGEVKVTDFGIAQAIGQCHSCKDNKVVGSVYYLAPEQACGEAVTPQSDLYSLGIVLFELLTGQLPFEADTPMEIALQHVQNTIPSLQKLRSDIPSVVERIVAKALAKKPLSRYATAADFKQDLEEAGKLLRKGAEAPAGAASGYVASTLGEQATVRIGRTERAAETTSTGSKRKWYYLAGLVLVGLALVGSFVAKQLTRTSMLVPNFCGKTVVEAESSLRKLGLSYELQEKYDAEVTSGRISQQEPTPGEEVTEGETVVLVISKGPETGVVPDLKGKTLLEAQSILQKCDVTLGEVTYEAKADVPAGTVIGQSIAAATKVGSSEKLNLVLNNEEKAVAKPATAESAKTEQPAPEASTVPATSNTEESTPARAPEIRKAIVEFVIPEAEGKQDVKLVLSNAEGGSTIYHNSLRGGVIVRQQVRVVGDTYVKLYVNDTLVEGKKL